MVSLQNLWRTCKRSCLTLLRKLGICKYVEVKRTKRMRRYIEDDSCITTDINAVNVLIESINDLEREHYAFIRRATSGYTIAVPAYPDGTAGNARSNIPKVIGLCRTIQQGEQYKFSKLLAWSMRVLLFKELRDYQWYRETDPRRSVSELSVAVRNTIREIDYLLQNPLVAEENHVERLMSTRGKSKLREYCKSQSVFISI